MIEVREIPIHMVRRNPLNPKGRGEVDRDLAASIASVGLIQMIVVRQLADGFQLIAGERRLVACASLGWESIPAKIYAGDAADGALMLVENGQRHDFTVLEEVELVVGLLSEAGATHESVGALLGHGSQWVAKRARIANLAPVVVEAIRKGEEPFATWPPKWLAEFALLSPQTQAALAADENGNQARWALEDARSLEDLQRIVRDHARPLRLAPWPLADAQLVPAVGACSSCPRSSCAARNLFGPEHADPADLEQGLCLDERCWHGKHQAHLARQIAEAKREHGERLILLQSFPAPKAASARPPPPVDQRHLPEGVRVYWGYEVESARRSTGVPALVLNGKKAGEVVFVCPRPTAAPPAASGSRGAAPKPDAGAVLAQKRAALEAKRAQWVAAKLGEEIEGSEWSFLHVPEVLSRHAALNSPDSPLFFVHVLQRAAVEGLLARDCRFDAFRIPKDARPKEFAGWFDGADLSGLWASLRLTLADAVAMGEHCRDLHALARIGWLAELVGADLGELIAQAGEALPTPPALARAEEKAKQDSRRGVKSAKDATAPTEDADGPVSGAPDLCSAIRDVLQRDSGLMTVGAITDAVVAAGHPKVGRIRLLIAAALKRMPDVIPDPATPEFFRLVRDEAKAAAAVAAAPGESANAAT